MGKVSDIDWSVEDGHPSEDELLLYVDGELEAKEAGYVRAHLEACWSCRVRTEKIQKTISSFINYRNSVLKPLIDSPPHGWRGFDRRLSQLAVESGKRPPFSNVLGSLRRLFSVGRLFNMPRPMVRVAVGLLVAVIVAALVIQFKQEPIVSASELLRNASDAQATQIRAMAQSVVYQRLQVRLKDQVTSREETVNLEIWNDTTNSRFRQSLADGGARQFIPSAADLSTIKTDQRKGASVPPVLVELEQVLQANYLDPQRPLSPVSYQSWRNTLAQKNDEVTRTQMPGNLEALTLRTVPTGQVGVGQIAEAVLVVRAKDWHPVEQRLRVRSDGGERVYELSETSFEVVSLTALSPEVFAEPKQVASVPTPSVVPTASPTPLLAANLQPSPLMIAPPARPVATADLEVEVLALLHQVGADVTEQVNVVRTQDKRLEVQGIVETEKRKSEILHALASVATNPAVKVDVQTVAEAVRRIDHQKKPPSGPSIVSRVDVTRGAIPVEAELRRYFSRDEDQTDERIRRFSARIINRSQQALFQASALKRLANRFTTEQLRTLDPRARNKWRVIIREHARAYMRETESLRQELQPIFPSAGQRGDAENEINIVSDANLMRAIARLYELAAANDHVVRSAFTLSTESSATSAIGTPQFWRSLRSAEKLATAVEKAY